MSDEHIVSCPICGDKTLRVNSMLYPVPFFNELVVFNMKCSACNFAHNDVFSAEDRGASRWTMHVNQPEHLNVRVVRSSSGTIRIPDFGIDVEPGPAAESFIANIEAVLQRIRAVVETAIGFADKASEKKRGREIAKHIDDAIAGRPDFTLIIEDPAGISGILPDDMRLVAVEELDPEEASQLRGAPMWIDNIREHHKERKG